IAYYLATGADAGDEPTFYHGTRVAGCIAGDNATSPASQVPRANPYTFATWDTGDGMAPGAQLVVQDIGTAAGAFVQGLSQEALLVQAYCSGARVHNSSVEVEPLPGANAYDGFSRDVDLTLWRLRDLTSVWPAGNWGQVDPATCPVSCQ